MQKIGVQMSAKYKIIAQLYIMHWEGNCQIRKII